MSCKSALYGANTASQTVAAGGVINFGSIVRRYGSNLNLAGDNLTLTGAGYYDIDASISFTAAAGTATIALYKDGTIIPGAEANVTTVADTSYSVTIPAIVRQICGAEATITAVLTGVAGTVTNAAITAEKI